MLLRSLFLFFIFQFTSAQEISLKGTVSSKGQPLEGVSILLKGSNYGTITDSNGKFKIRITNIKNQKLIFSYIGYRPETRIISSKISNLGIIELIPDKSLEEVVISGTLKPLSKLDSPVPVEVYSQTFFKANPTASVFEALENINGIRPQLNCNVCNTGDIHINGQEGSYTMILIDGLPIVSGLSTVYGLSGIPQSLIERVEIVKGPASTLYGSEAVGGIINLITKLPENTPSFSFDSFVSGWGEVNTDLGYKYKLSNKSLGLLGINYFNYSNPVDNNKDGFTDLTLQDRISIFNKFTFNNGLSLVGRFIYEDRWGGQMNWTPENRGRDSIYGESIYTTRIEIFGNYQLRKNYSLNFSFNDHSQNSAYGLNLFNANQIIGFGQFVWNNNLKNHDILFGLSYRYTYYDDNTTASFDENQLLNQPTFIHLPGVLFQDQIKLNSNNNLMLGLRYDYNSLHGNIFTPRINYKLNSIDKSTSLRLSFGSGYRVAQIFTEDHAALTGARDVIFLENLDPERSWNFNLNFLKKFYLKEGALLDIDISLFHTQFSNKIIPDYDTDPNKIIYSNLFGSSTNQGASLNINFFAQKRIRFNLGVTFIDSFIIEESSKTIPYLTERFHGVYKIEKKWDAPRITIDLTGNTTGPLKLPTLGPYDPRPSYSKTFHILNFQLTKSWNNIFESYGGIKNIFNFRPPNDSIARSFDPFDSQVIFDPEGNAISTLNNPYALTFDPSYVFASNQGIRFFFGLRWKHD
ncbi:MAG: TonB-dependent receptor [Flavobacteriaceae bacterium]|nr:TonB-dependent receptor [Flavobacteriaceae bacterium]